MRFLFILCLSFTRCILAGDSIEPALSIKIEFLTQGSVADAQGTPRFQYGSPLKLQCTITNNSDDTVGINGWYAGMESTGAVLVDSISKNQFDAPSALNTRPYVMEAVKVRPHGIIQFSCDIFRMYLPLQSIRNRFSSSQVLSPGGRYSFMLSYSLSVSVGDRGVSPKKVSSNTLSFVLEESASKPNDDLSEAELQRQKIWSLIASIHRDIQNGLPGRIDQHLSDPDLYLRETAIVLYGMHLIKDRNTLIGNSFLKQALLEKGIPHKALIVAYLLYFSNAGELKDLMLNTQWGSDLGVLLSAIENNPDQLFIEILDRWIAEQNDLSEYMKTAIIQLKRKLVAAKPSP